MSEPIDIVEEYGIVNLADVEYKGNFTINYKNKDQLIMLQKFFGVRCSKFDMKLLEKRPSLMNELEKFEYDKNSDS